MFYGFKIRKAFQVDSDWTAEIEFRFFSATTATDQTDLGDAERRAQSSYKCIIVVACTGRALVIWSKHLYNPWTKNHLVNGGTVCRLPLIRDELTEFPCCFTDLLE